MLFPKSLRVQLSLVYLLAITLLTALGSLGLFQLIDVNEQSELIRDHWLQSTRVLGDLNNFTSDFRAAEANRLLASDSMSSAADEELAELDRKIGDTIRSYQGLPHERFEQELFDRFKASWFTYRATADSLLGNARAHRQREAEIAYSQASRAQYNLASDTLGELTAKTVAAAGSASSQSVLAYKHAKTWLLVGLTIALGATLALVWYINRTLSKPLSRLVAHMRSLTTRHTDIRIDGVDRHDEIGEMARAVSTFRQNAIDLELTQQRLVQQTEILQQNLQEERRLTTVQRNFVSMVSHEFRTPLTIIDGQAQRMIKLRSSLQAGDIEERAQKIRGAVLRVTHVMESLLASARLFDSDPRQHFKLSCFEPKQLLADVCHLHRDINPTTRIIDAPGQLPDEAFGDPHLLFQALSNLLSNAIKYSPAEAEIHVIGGATDDSWWVSVTDLGIGIPPADLPRVFERYHRGANVSGFTGTGIGLYLVRTVVELHGGTVQVESKLSQGARFTVNLPMHPKLVEPAVSPPSDATASRGTGEEPRGYRLHGREPNSRSLL